MAFLTLILMATPFEDGSTALLKKDWQAAVDAFTIVIEDKPTAQAHVNRSIAFSHLGKLKESFNDCNAAIKLNPKLAEAYYNRARLYVKARLIERALKDFDKSIALKPTAIFHTEKGATLHSAKRYGEAKAAYNAALMLNPNDPSALNNLAWLQATCPDAKFRDGRSAVELASKACQLTMFKVPSYSSTLAAAYAELGEFDKAVLVAKKIDDNHLATYRAGKAVRDGGE